MKTCKFCGVQEGAPDRRGKAAHINRDGLCAPCYYVLQRIKYQPEAVSPVDKQWFEEMCEANKAQRRRVDALMRHAKEVGMVYTGPAKRFVPVAQRREWSCARCGTADIHRRDSSYTRYCESCAYEVRHNRNMPARANRKTRSDKGTPRGGRL